MKKLTLLLSCLLLSAAPMWAQIQTRSVEAEEQHQLRLAAEEKEDYEVAAQAGEKELQLIRQQQGATDSLQIRVLTHLGTIYRKMGNIDQAIAKNKEGVELCLQWQRADDLDLAVMYDNLSFYYGVKKEYKEAMDYSQKSLEIFYRLMPNNIDMAFALSHAAESAFALEMYSDAVLYQDNACQLLSELKGRHSALYLGELDYLVKYCKSADQKERAAETEQLIEQLKEENKTGYVPMAADLSTPEKCKMHNEDAYYACLYYQHHPLSADSMLLVSKYIFNFVSNSKDVSAIFGVGEEKWVQDEKSYPYLVAYMSGFVTHQLSHPEEKEFSWDAYAYAVACLMSCYSNNHHLTGDIKALDDKLASFKKDRNKYWKGVEKDFQVFLKANSKGQTTNGPHKTIDY